MHESKALTKGRSNVLKDKRNLWEDQQLRYFAEMATGGISYPDFIKACIDADKQNHRMSRIHHEILCFRSDGIFQLNEAIKAVFGAVVANEEKGPSAGDQTVNMVDITLADGTRIKAPYGDIALDSLGDGSMISINYDNEKHKLIVDGKCPQMYLSIMDGIIKDTRDSLTTNSIYKNQAITISDINYPEILNLDSTEKELMVLSEKTEYALIPIYARIKNPDACVQKGIPLKYGCLLAGGYGTGKTLLAFKIAKMAVDCGWMFIYLKDPKMLAETLRMAKVIDRSGHGVVLFLEDVDQVTRGNRDAAMQDILNTLDGGDTKDMNVISIFTTNHLELIEPTFLRGKRVSKIITLGALDQKTADEFIRKSMGQTNPDGSPMYIIPDDLTAATEHVAKSNIVPAFMADIIEAVKTTMVHKDENVLDPNYIIFEVDQHLDHVKLSKTKDMTETPESAYVKASKTALGINSLASDLKTAVEKLNKITDKFGI